MPEKPNPEALFELIDGFRRSQTLFAAVKLGVFDGARPQATELSRLLDACVSLGLLEKAGSEYLNTALADAYLRTDCPGSLAGYIRCAAEDFYPKWSGLAEAVLGRKPEEPPKPSLFGTLFHRPKQEPKAEDRTKDFMSGMHGYGLVSSPRVAEAFDFSRFHAFVDLGGSTGHLALAMQAHYPNMSVAVVDIPSVMEHTKHYAGDRAKLHAGDLFADPLPPGDLYALGKVLHNCTDERIGILLQRIHNALPTGGGLMVVERLLAEDRNGPVHAHLSSLNMLISSHGRERTFSEYRAFLEKAGFQEVVVKKTGGLVDVIFGVKS
ncbi:MAG: methyltransferase [Bryobacteraceae bacterium]